MALYSHVSPSYKMRGLVESIDTGGRIAYYKILMPSLLFMMRETLLQPSQLIESQNTGLHRGVLLLLNKKPGFGKT
eukprot:scaffold164642_cov29-Prasinocladus_malaysianus.AAC.1